MNQYSFQDLRDLVDAAERHAQAYSTRETVTAEAEADAYQHLAHAVGALERLSSAADAVRAPLASEQVAHQTDNADALGEFFAEVVGDRAYGFEPVDPRAVSDER
jgi:cytochrome c1